MNNEERYRDAVRAVSDELESQPEECPPEQTLIAYHMGSMDADASEGIRSHLVFCRRCRGTLTDAAVFFDPTAPPPAAPDFTEEWKKLDRRIRGTKPHWWALLATAAAIFVVAGISLSWVLNLKNALEAENFELRQQLTGARSELARLGEPQANVPIYDVFSSRSLARSAGAGFVNLLPALTSAPATWILTAEDSRDYPAYALDIFEQRQDGTERLVWRTESLRRAPHRNFVITLPGGYLREGTYLIRVSGQEAQSWRAVSEYKVELSSSAAERRKRNE